MDNKKKESYKFSLETLKGVFSKCIEPKTVKDEKTGLERKTTGSYIIGVKSGDIWNSTFISKSLVSINKDLDGTRLGIVMFLPKHFEFKMTAYNIITNQPIEGDETILKADDIKEILLSKKGVELITV